MDVERREASRGKDTVEVFREKFRGAVTGRGLGAVRVVWLANLGKDIDIA